MSGDIEIEAVSSAALILCINILSVVMSIITFQGHYIQRYFKTTFQCLGHHNIATFFVNVYTRCLGWDKEFS